MKLAILGIGSIGGWLAGALAGAGVEPKLVARGATLEALRSRGLCVERDGSQRCYSLPAGPASAFGPQDYIILAVKAQQLSAALADLRPLLGADSCVVSAMNGIPWWFFSGLLGCVVHASARLLAPGHVKVNSVDRLVFGEPGGQISERVQSLSDAFSRAGLVSNISANVRFDIWTKLWGNMNINPLSALARASTGRLLGDPDVRQLCLNMMAEMAETGAQLGLTLQLSPPERMAMTRKLGDFRPSMLQDIDAGRELEYQAQLGAVVEIARRLDVPAPFCASVLGLTRLLSQSVSAR
jgi:2-dehydropantoate 2-reductase